jgi:hypothetical protein
VGTSASSKGSPGNVPMVPPWVPAAPADPVAPEDGTDDAKADDAPVDPATVTAPPAAPPVAHSGRFTGARLNLGNFAGNGEPAAMRRGVGQYFKSGYGGGTTAARRFGGTAQTAGGLFGALTPGGVGPAAPDRSVLGGRSADEIMDAVVEAVRPIDGTQDGEASRAAIRDALSDLLEQFPEADLLNLDDTQRQFAVERFVALDVFRRLQLDLGKTIQDKAPTILAAMARLKEVREYVKETVAESFRQLRAAGTRLAAGVVTRVVQAAVGEAITVFESYVQ